MLDRLAALITNVADKAPTTITVSSLDSNLLRHMMHACQECTVRRGVA